MTQILLIIDETTYLEIDVSSLVEKIYRYDEATVNYIHKQNKIILFSDDFIIDVLEPLEYLINKIIEKNLELEKKYYRGLGYCWSKQSHKIATKEIGKINLDTKPWHGTKYALWESKTTHSYLYVKEGKIYIEVAPLYQWHYRDPRKNEKYFTFEEFIKNYKPLVVKEISYETILEWDQQVKELMKIIRSNDPTT